MRVLLSLILLLTLSAIAGSQDKGRDIVLGAGVKLHIEEMSFSRFLPTAYYDQAMSSIPVMYPESEIVAATRFGRFDNNPANSYSLICYKQTPGDDEVTINGVVVSNKRAWSFGTRVDSSGLNEALRLVVETLANWPSNRSMELDGANSSVGFPITDAQGYA